MRAERGKYSGRPVPIPGYVGKPCTVWVGCIAPSVSEGTMREILEQCGTVKSMNSYIDSTKGFCLVAFSEPEGSYLAEHLLRGLVLDGQALKVHLNRCTKHMIINLNAEKSKSNLPVVSQDLETKARETIDAILRNRETLRGKATKDADAAATDFLTSLSHEPRGFKKIEVVPPKKTWNVGAYGNTREHWREALRTLQKNERERLRRHELETDKKRDLIQERQRQITADNEIFDPREVEPIHLRNMYGNSREHIDRKKRKEKEIAADLDEERRLIKEQQSKQTLRQSKVSSGMTREMAQKKNIMFGEEDPDVEHKRLIPIKYSKEEMAPGRNRASKEALKKSIMAKIPKSMDELEKYKVKWEYFDVAGESVHRKILGWIGKKIRELMGEDESSFCDFIFQELVSHRSPGDLIRNLTEVLDEDTENFVIKLFGVIIYETERIMNS